MARVVVAGAGAIGASIAYHLALRGADGVVLADVGEIAGGATGKAMGGVRQQFTTEAEVRLAQASVAALPRARARRSSSRSATSSSRRPTGGSPSSRSGASSRRRSACRSRASTRRSSPASRVDDVLGATICREDGIADPAGVTRELVRRAAELGVDVRERTDALELDADDARDRLRRTFARSWRRRAASSFPSGRSCGSSQTSARSPAFPRDLPMTIEENGFHFRRVGDDGLRPRDDRAEPRWDGPRRCRERSRRGLARAARASATRRPPARRLRRAWAGFYDMTPDAHPIIGQVADGVYAACGFSGHGFMQSPAVGDAVAAELLGEEPPFDLSPYRLERFEAARSSPRPWFWEV